MCNEGITHGMPDSIVGSVQNRLAALEPQVAEVIVAAAVLGRQFDWTLLPAICDATDAGGHSRARASRDVQLIEPHAHGHGWLRFRHSLTRAAIISGLLPPDLARRSAAAAAAVEAAHPGLPGAWCELAAELHEAAGQHAQAARLLLEAGRRDLSTARSERRRDARARLGRSWDTRRTPTRPWRPTSMRASSRPSRWQATTRAWPPSPKRP